MAWRAEFPSGDVTAVILGDPVPNRLERAEALRAILPPPRNDERGDLGADGTELVVAIKAGAAATARHFGLSLIDGEWATVASSDR